MGSRLPEDWPRPVSETGCAATDILTSVGGGIIAIVSSSLSESSALLCVSSAGHAREMEGGTTLRMEKGVALALLKTPALSPALSNDSVD